MLAAIILIHILVILANLFCLLILIAELFSSSSDYDWFILFPAIVFLISLLSSSESCILTRIENKIRLKKGLPQIKAFIKHYFFKINT